MSEDALEHWLSLSRWVLFFLFNIWADGFLKRNKWVSAYNREIEEATQTVLLCLKFYCRERVFTASNWSLASRTTQLDGKVKNKTKQHYCCFELLFCSAVLLLELIRHSPPSKYILDLRIFSLLLTVWYRESQIYSIILYVLFIIFLFWSTHFSQYSLI